MSKRREPETVVFDVDHQDHVTRHRFVSDREGPIVDETLRDYLPEEYLMALKDCLGDALAQITVGGDLATSVDYGNKAGAFCSIKVTFGNNEKDLTTAHGIARDIAHKFTQEDQAKMEEILNQARGISPRKTIAKVNSDEIIAKEPETTGNLPSSEAKPISIKVPRKARPSYKR